MSGIERQDAVFFVPVPDCWLVVAPLQRTCALVNESGAREIRNGVFPDGPEWSELAETLSGTPLEEPRPATGALQARMLGLIPTRACNLRCGYCGFGAGLAGDGGMAPEMAVAAIDWMAMGFAPPTAMLPMRTWRVVLGFTALRNRLHGTSFRSVSSWH